MTDNNNTAHPALVQAHQVLKTLHQHAGVLNGELLRLQQLFTTLQTEFDALDHDNLVRVNRQLQLSTMQAQRSLSEMMQQVNALTLSCQHDVLTDTPNRILMLDRINRAISYAHRHQRRVALVFLDLDHFKQINDQYGHETGDEVLKLVSQRLQQVLRASDTISRHGGDEFLLLLSTIDTEQAASAVAQKILTALALPAVSGGQTLTIRASLGIAFYPSDGADALELIRAADNAMYQAKSLGGHRFCLSQPARQLAIGPRNLPLVRSAAAVPAATSRTTEKKRSILPLGVMTHRHHRRFRQY